MNALYALEAQVQSLSGGLARARTELEADNLVDLAAIEVGVDELCARAKTLSSDDGRALRPRLLALLDDFGHLSRAIEARLETIKRDLGDSTGRQAALRAYAKTPGPHR